LEKGETSFELSDKNQPTEAKPDEIWRLGEHEYVLKRGGTGAALIYSRKRQGVRIRADQRKIPRAVARKRIRQKKRDKLQNYFYDVRRKNSCTNTIAKR